ncbi:RNA polymerase sigma factor [Streptomyces griseoaurantiacus]|uniref:RNA polymerase sigma factor n=1 Tax=Streptomyces griseoaurantiacus TaxID=68213 RepID=UPI003246950D
MKPVHAAWGNIETPEAYYKFVLKRRVVDLLRKVLPQNAAETTLQNALDESEVPVPTEVLQAIASPETPEDIVMAQESEASLTLVLRKLRPAYRASLYLTSQGFRAEERAEIKGVPVSTERTHLERARQQCMDLLAGIEPEDKSDAVKSAEKYRELSKKEGEEA